MNQFWWLDFTVAVCYLVFAVMTGYRGGLKLIAYRANTANREESSSRRTILSGDRLNTGRSASPPSYDDPDEIVSASQSPCCCCERFFTDRRVPTIVLLLLISFYSVVRVGYLTLGGCGLIPMDGSLEGNFATVIPATFFMLIQSAMIAKWGIHARDSEWILHARVVTMHSRFVIGSVTAACIALSVTLAALVDFEWQVVRLRAGQWNEMVGTSYGVVYIGNGTVFIYLGLRLYFMWRSAAQSDDAGDLAQDFSESERSPHRLSNNHCIINCCSLGKQIGSRGYRILAVAFGFGMLLIIRGIGLLSYAIDAVAGVHNLNHNESAPALALLFEIVCLFITLKLLMPPGKADGEDLANSSPLRASGASSASRLVTARSASSVAASEGRRHMQRQTAQWANAHVVDETMEGSPSASWRVGTACDDDDDDVA